MVDAMKAITGGDVTLPGFHTGPPPPWRGRVWGNGHTRFVVFFLLEGRGRGHDASLWVMVVWDMLPQEKF